MNLKLVLFLVSIGVSSVVGRRRQSESEEEAPSYVPFDIEYGPCPNPRTVQNFNPMKFTGVWYDIKHYKNELLTGKCGTINIKWDFEDEIMNFTYTNTETVEYIRLTPINLADGVFNVIRDGRDMEIEFNILDTDYVNYAVIWACDELNEGNKHAQLLHIFGRTRTLAPQIMSTVENILSSNKLPIETLENVVQKGKVCRN